MSTKAPLRFFLNLNLKKRVGLKLSCTYTVSGSASGNWDGSLNSSSSCWNTCSGTSPEEAARLKRLKASSISRAVEKPMNRVEVRLFDFSANFNI